MDTPSIVKVLRYLRSAGVPVGLNDIIMATGGSQTPVRKALETLAADGIVAGENNAFRYVPGSKADDLTEKLFQLYPDAEKRAETELTLRGVICHLGTPRAYLRVGRLVEIMAKDGHAENDVRDLLKKEKDAGFTESLWINFKTREPGTAVGLAYGREANGKIRATSLSAVPCPPPLAIPGYFFTYSFDVSPENLKSLKDAVTGQESDPEEYVSGNYPAEIAAAAVKRFLGKRPAMAGAIKDEADREWVPWKRGNSMMDFTYGLSG